MAAAATTNLRDFINLLESDSAADYPYYCVLIYPPLNGLNQRLHEYVVSHWNYLNQLTGWNCLLLAVEDIDRQIGEYKPEEIYAIARILGVRADAIPCMVFFTKPGTRPEVLILRLREFLPDTSSLTDEDLTDLFQSLQAVIDSCVEDAVPDSRLDCLREGVDKRWPVKSRWRDQLAGAKGVIIPSLTATASVLQALMKILPMIR